jgi:phosphoserine phosphatase
MNSNLVAIGCPSRGVSSFNDLGTAIGSQDFQWLSVGQAALFQLERSFDTASVRSLTEHAATLGIDLFITHKPLEKKKLLVADMEATIILDEMLDLLAEELGLGEAVANITSLAMNGRIDFTRSLAARTALFAGTPENRLLRLCDRIRFTPGAKCLVSSMKKAGARTVLVTGGYDVFAQRVKEACGFDEVIANKPAVQDGLLTGQLVPPVCSAGTKREVLERACRDLGVSPEHACAIGDGANDIDMLKVAGLSASYNGKPVLRDVVDFNVVHSDLTAVLFAQGYRASEISAQA